jgi:16S rRNA (guanine527-N7)-methyltransferase
MTRIDSSAAFRSAFGVSCETCARLETYDRLLRQWQKAVNLVAPRTLDDVWHRHFADSAQIVAHIPAGAGPIVDLGSGGGFPGLVTAILLAERSSSPPVTLVEADTRKAAFLREVARAVAVPVDILVMRIENAETQVKLADAGIITARALAPLDRLFSAIAASFQPRATGLFLKGRDAAAEIADAEKSYAFRASLVPSVTDPDARLIVVTALRAKPET